MVNPIDGKGTYYHSSVFGFGMKYRTMSDLVRSNNDYGMEDKIEQN